LAAATQTLREAGFSSVQETWLRSECARPLWLTAYLEPCCRKATIYDQYLRNFPLVQRQQTPCLARIATCIGRFRDPRVSRPVFAPSDDACPQSTATGRSYRRADAYIDCVRSQKAQARETALIRGKKYV